MLGKVFGGLEEYAPLLVRLGLATIFIYKGVQTIFGTFGGPGLDKTAELFGEKGYDLPLPILLASLAGIAALGGGFLLAVGLITRYAAATLFVLVIITLFVAYGGRVFSDGLGAFACLIMAFTLLLTGGGKGSLDRILKIDERV
ncbi:MAG TPA: DoxX family protein [Planctomycetota bacterium]|nr:DoxX family protein [Planctomycetota bacterium]